jgi:hypothetical protein
MFTMGALKRNIKKGFGIKNIYLSAFRDFWKNLTIFQRKKGDLRTFILYLILLFFTLSTHVQADANAEQSTNLDLQTAIKTMQSARSHSGYDFSQTKKCLFPYISTITDNWTHIPLLMRNELGAMFQRPDKSDSWWYVAGLPKIFVTPHFKFHYTTQGPDAVISGDRDPLNGVPDLVDICAEAFEKSYRVEVTELGYKAPYDDFWQKDNGGDERYDVYLFSGPWLGFTMPEEPVSVQSTAIASPSYFGINSRTYEFVGALEGKKYIETTCCHEFFHSIQFAYNYLSERWFMESSSTWMEGMVYDGSEQGETDGNNYYNSQLTYWFRYPDWSLTRFDGWHEYGSVIWDIFLTERYDIDIVKDIFESMAEGTYRELASFNDAFTSRGTRLINAFKEFTVWNYFTNFRYDKRFYSHGAEYPPVPVHLDDVISKYPMKTDLDTEKSPENLGARYIRFLPAEGQNNISIKIDGSDITDPDDLQRLDTFGNRGWGAKLIIYQKDRSPKVDEIMPFHKSQEGQRNYVNFGTEIQEIVLVLINLHPDLDISSVSYSAGQQPAGKLSEPKLSQNDKGKIIVSWELLDISGIKDVAIIRKRYDPSERDQDDNEIRPFEVYSATDADGDGIPDGNINIIGKVSATDTTFVDNTTFNDVDTGNSAFDPQLIHYYYAVVPVSENGIMGIPAIAKGGITPIQKQSPSMFITTQLLAPGEWQIYLRASEPLIQSPNLITIAPDGRRIPVKLEKSADGNQLWQGKLLVDFSIPSGTYTYIASARNYSGMVGTYIAEGSEFQYTTKEDKGILCYPNPFRPNVNKQAKFRPSGLQIKIYSVTGELVKTLQNTESEWDGMNESGQPVVSGTYIFTAEGNGIKRIGKIAVLW